MYAFFQSYIDDNQCCLKLLCEADSKIAEVDGALVFTLSDLYQLLFDDSLFSYQQFRSMLYSSGLNAALLKQGYQIQVHSSTAKVDSSHYQLLKLS